MLYTQFAEEILAMPVLPGLKSESEKFAGALRTYCIEAMMQDKKALQAGTSHNLSTNFAEAFETKFLDKDGKQKTVHQTSWGVSTRLIGGMIMTHSDDKGLVLPPRLASIHVVIVPIMAKADQTPRVLEAADQLKAAIEALGAEMNKLGTLPYDVGVHVDKDETKQAGWKFFEHELLGTPVRIECGPRDLDKGQVVMTRRDIGQKEFIPIDQAPKRAMEMLIAMQKELLEKARAFREANTHRVETYAEFKQKLEEPGGFFETAWCQSKECEAKVKEETKATIRCLPLDSQFNKIPEPGACMACGKSPCVRAVFARSY
jgi:prolyl-tRNA synthetase